MSVVIAVGSLLAGAISWHLITEAQRRHFQAAHAADIREHLVIWPSVDPDLKQLGNTPDTEPPTRSGSTVLPSPRRIAVLGDSNLSATVGPRHKEAS